MVRFLQTLRKPFNSPLRISPTRATPRVLLLKIPGLYRKQPLRRSHPRAENWDRVAIRRSGHLNGFNRRNYEV